MCPAKLSRAKPNKTEDPEDISKAVLHFSQYD